MKCYQTWTRTIAGWYGQITRQQCRAQIGPEFVSPLLITVFGRDSIVSAVENKAEQLEVLTAAFQIEPKMTPL